PIYGGGLVLLCPNGTPRQLTTRRQKVAVTKMLGNFALTGNLAGRARPPADLARRSCKRRGPVRQLHAGSTRGRPFGRTRRAGQSRQEARTFPAGITWDRKGPPGAFLSHIFKNRLGSVEARYYITRAASGAQLAWHRLPEWQNRAARSASYDT